MSTNIYSAFEYVDQKTGRWETEGLYKYRREGVYDLAQLITGHSEHWAAISGDEPFDFPINDNGETFDNMVDPLEQIDEIIKYATSGDIPPNAATHTKEYYEKFVSSGLENNSGIKYHPPCVTYTLRDLSMLEMLARSVSPKAVRFYNKYFAQIQWLLRTIMLMEYVNGGSDVRVIIWVRQ